MKQHRNNKDKNTQTEKNISKYVGSRLHNCRPRPISVWFQWSHIELSWDNNNHIINLICSFWQIRCQITVTKNQIPVLETRLEIKVKQLFCKRNREILFL